jgi:hypothetical protein
LLNIELNLTKEVSKLLVILNDKPENYNSLFEENNKNFDDNLSILGPKCFEKI